MVTTLSSVVAKMLLCCIILRNCGHHIWLAWLLHNPSGTPMPSNLSLVPMFCICPIIRKEGSNSASTGHMSADRHEIFLTRLICRRPTMFYNQLIVMHRKFGTNAPTSIIWTGKLLHLQKRRCRTWGSLSVSQWHLKYKYCWCLSILYHHDLFLTVKRYQTLTQKMRNVELRKMTILEIDDSVDKADNVDNVDSVDNVDNVDDTFLQHCWGNLKQFQAINGKFSTTVIPW